MSELLSNQSESEQQLNLLISVPCKGCGSQMSYDAKFGQMLCGHCGNQQPAPAKSDMVIEQDFIEAINTDNTQKGFGFTTKNFACSQCGAITAVEVTAVVLSCSFCGSNRVNLEAYENTRIKPAGILPFRFTKEKALETYKTWLGNGWFQPSNLQAIARLDKIHGVYVPFWTYDAHTDSEWYAESGYYYYVTVEYTDEHGNTQTRQEQRIRWVPTNGYYQNFFDDVLVIGSKGVSQNRIQNIYPFPLEKTINYDPQYLLGWQSELYGLDVKDGFNVANKIMDDYIYSACARMVPGDTYRNLQVHTRKSGITFKHLLLPVWIAAYLYNGKSYQVVLNGITGKISGEKPLSPWKIALAVIIGLIIFAIFMYFAAKKG